MATDQAKVCIPKNGCPWSTITGREMQSPRAYTVKILKFGTPQTIAIIVLKIEKFDVTLH